MARLTYQDADGSWGLHGVSWDQLAALPPRVYGALVRLRDLEARMETEAGEVPAEMEEGGESSWIQQRFARVT